MHSLHTVQLYSLFFRLLYKIPYVVQSQIKNAHSYFSIWIDHFSDVRNGPQNSPSRVLNLRARNTILLNAKRLSIIGPQETISFPRGFVSIGKKHTGRIWLCQGLRDNSRHTFVVEGDICGLLIEYLVESVETLFELVLFLLLKPHVEQVLDWPDTQADNQYRQ